MYQTIFRLLPFVVFTLMQSGAAAQPQGSPLAEAFRQFSSDRAVTNANWSIVVYDVSSQIPVLVHNPDKPLVPASTQKLLTSATALLTLGAAYQYETHLEYDGYIGRDGTLNGNLFVRGSGDPSFGSSLLDDSLAIESTIKYFIQAIIDAGIKKIAGHVIADESIFDNEMVPRRWVWEHIGNYFGAGTSGLSVNENEYTAYFNAGNKIGASASLAGTQPVIPGMVLINEVTTGPSGSGDQVYIFGSPFQNERRLTGTVPLGARNFPVRGSMAEPAQYFADVFAAFINKSGIEVSGNSMSLRFANMSGIIPDGERTTIYSYHSPHLFDIIYRTNLASVNSYAESLLKTLGKETNGSGSTNAGLEAIYTFWSAYGIDPSSWSLFDGSGLSPSNRLTANQLLQVLEVTAAHPAFSVLIHSLPLAGYSGSLGPHFRGTPSEGVLRAKSGYLTNARAFAGYTPMQNGNLAAFVFIVNDYQDTPAGMRNKMFRLMDAITRHDGQPLQ